MPSPGQKFTEVPVLAHLGKMWTFDRKTAIKAAEAWLSSHPLEAPMPGSEKALSFHTPGRYDFPLNC